MMLFKNIAIYISMISILKPIEGLPVKEYPEIHALISKDSGSQIQSFANTDDKQIPFSLNKRDNIEVSLGGDDIAKLAKYAKKKSTEKAADVKDTIKGTIKDKIMSFKQQFKNTPATHLKEATGEGNQHVTEILGNSELLQLLENGGYKIIKQDGQEEASVLGSNKRKKNIKSNQIDEWEETDYVPQDEDDQDPFES